MLAAIFVDIGVTGYSELIVDIFNRFSLISPPGVGGALLAVDDLVLMYQWEKRLAPHWLTWAFL